MRTGTPRFARSSVRTALGLLVFGTIVASLLLVSLHFRSEDLWKQSDRAQRYGFEFEFEYGLGPPGAGENGSGNGNGNGNGSVADSSFRRGGVAKAGTISASASASATGSPRKGAMNSNNDNDNDNNNDNTVENDTTTDTSSATVRTAGGNEGGSQSQSHSSANAAASAERHNGSDNDTDSDSDTGCLARLNSRAWLESERLGNQNGGDSRIIDRDYVEASILKIPRFLSGDEADSQSILKRTLCDKTSRFLAFKFSTSLRDGDGDGDGDPNGRTHSENGSAAEPAHGASESSRHRRRILHRLALRLTYLSVHAHQHKDAIPEARHRLEHSEACDAELEARNIGAFDFECPDARFLVVPLKRSGLGGQARLIASAALMGGISSDRVVVFANGSPVGPKFLREPWELTSPSRCPRRDKQCFFLPDTPCVPTLSEIANATVLGRAERRGLFRTGGLPERLKGERVLVMNSIDRPQREPPNLRSRIADIARERLIDPLARENPNDPRLPLLREAADHILNDGEGIGDDSFYYFGRNFRAHHAMVFYALRPKLEYAEKIDWILERTLESDHRTDLSLGLPIRASDKCIVESECPPFETYMSLMQTVWDANEKELRRDAVRTPLGGGRTALDSATTTTAAATLADPPLSSHAATNISIIVTSESPDVLEAQRAFRERSRGHDDDDDETKHLSFPFEFVTNRFDVLPNTGNPAELSDSRHDREEVLLSALASLKLQFHAKYTVGNCCSNHHLLLFDFLNEGCGAGDVDHRATCMQDHEDARFRLCCAWTKTEECIAKRSRREGSQSQRNATAPP